MSPSSEKIQMVAARIAEYKNLDAHLATQVLLNDRLHQAMKRMNDDELATT
jgi:hypothetical protein